MELYRHRFTQYANEAQNDLAEALGMKRTEGMLPHNGEVNLNSLERRCLRLESIRQLGHEVPFRTGDLPQLVLLPYTSAAEITYRYLPQPLKNADDVSELPEHLHPLIVTYCVGRERMGGDVSTQHGGNIYLSMYNAAKAKLRGWIDSDDAFKIVNRY